MLKYLCLRIFFVFFAITDIAVISASDWNVENVTTAYKGEEKKLTWNYQGTVTGLTGMKWATYNPATQRVLKQDILKLLDNGSPDPTFQVPIAYKDRLSGSKSESNGLHKLSLTIKNLIINDTNVYFCSLLTFPGGIIYGPSIFLNVTEVKKEETETTKPGNTAAIIGGAVAGSVVVIVAVGIGIYFWKKK